jgi:hypothetical protein
MSANETDVGTEDLEKGLRPAPASTFATILVVTLAMLLVFNSAGLDRWTRELPPGVVNAWLAARAAEWHGRMVRLGPARLYEAARHALDRQ